MCRAATHSQAALCRAGALRRLKARVTIGLGLSVRGLCAELVHPRGSRGKLLPSLGAPSWAGNPGGGAGSLSSSCPSGCSCGAMPLSWAPQFHGRVSVGEGQPLSHRTGAPQPLLQLLLWAPSVLSTPLGPVLGSPHCDQEGRGSPLIPRTGF